MFFKTEIFNNFRNEQKIVNIENNFENFKENVNKTNDHIKDVIEKRGSELHTEGKTFICKLCEFSTDSSSGLITHIKRKHSKEMQTCPFEFELCDCKLENKIELKNHMVTHSFRSVNLN